MSERQCRHPDIRKFDGLRCCLACGEAVFETSTVIEANEPQPAIRTTYKYTNLNYKLGQEIRLIVLYPGELADDLHCEIIHVNLDDDPYYEAVSYTWASDDGDASFSRKIDCGDHAYIPITANCDAALRQLRKRGLKRRLWIDAVSIDQTNVQERNHQVGFMDRIYSLARSVRISIQDGPMGSGSGYSSLFDWLRHGDISETTTSVALPHSRCLLSHRYFKRAWTIQEVALARTVYLHVNGEEIFLGKETLEKLQYIATRNNCRLPGGLRLRRKANFILTGDIVSCLRAGIEAECADPRDKIFAVLSLMDPKARSLIPIDYALDLETVWENAALAVIISNRNLDAISYSRVRHMDEPNLDPNLCSIPTLSSVQFKDFLDKASQESSMDGGIVDFILCKSDIAPLSQLQLKNMNRWREKIEVRIVDDISIIPDLPDEDTCQPVIACRGSHCPTNILPHLQVRAHFIDIVRSSRSVRRGYRNSNSTFWRDKLKTIEIFRAFDRYPGWNSNTTLTTSDLYSSQSGTNWYVQPGLLQWYNHISGENHTSGRYSSLVGSTYGILKPLIDFIKAMQKYSEGRLFLEASTSIGFGSPGFRPGDEIWALDGARLPFILRKTERKTFQIVSDCYLWTVREPGYWNLSPEKGELQDTRPPSYGNRTHIIEID